MVQILLDECVHVKLQYRFEEYNKEFQVSTVNQEKWNGIKNGKLLSLAKQKFDIFITSDQNIQFQQDISKFSIAVLILRAKSNRYSDLLKFVEPASEAILSAEEGKLYLIPEK